MTPKILFSIILVALTAIGLALLIHGLKLYSRYGEFHQHGEATQGVIVDIDPEWGISGRWYYPSYRYTDKQGRDWTGSTTGGFSKDEFQVGQTVDVVYHWVKVTQAELAHPSSLRYPALYRSAAGLILFFGPIAIFFIRRLFRDDRGDANRSAGSYQQ